MTDVGWWLRDARVGLRDFKNSDEDAFVAWAAEESMYEFMRWRLETEESARAEFHRLVGHPKVVRPNRRYWFVAVTNPSEEFCGIAGLESAPLNTAEFGWYLSRRFHGQGLATAATQLMIDFAFNSVGVDAVIAKCDPENHASRRVIEKSGLQLYGEEQVETWRGPRPRLCFRRQTHSDSAHQP